MLKCKILVGLRSVESTGRKKNIPYMNNPNTLISRKNKPATIRSSGGQIRAPIFLGVYFVWILCEGESKVKVAKTLTQRK